MQKSKICKNKFFSFCLIYSFLEVLGYKLYFKPNLYFYVKYANMQNSNSSDDIGVWGLHHGNHLYT